MPEILGSSQSFNIMTKMSEVYTGIYRVRSYETDFRGRVRPVTLLNYLQDAASLHASALGFSVDDLREKNATWMLSRYHIKFFHYPVVGDEVRIFTWRSACEGFYALRDFEIIDAADNPVCVATSSWVVLNLTTKRPVRVESVVGDFPCFERRALPDEFSSLQKLETCTLELPFRVRTGDVDLNRHVNHVVYAEWALEAVPSSVLMNSLPFDIEISYRSEAMLGDRILSRSSAIDMSDSTTFLHQLLRDGDGRELTRLKTVWHTKP
jgi:acyl-ACP thioesterase